MKYFHKFNSQQEFNEAYNGSEYTQPWVSYTVEGKEIDYNKHSKEYWKNFSIPFTIEALGTGEITWALGSKTLSYQKNNGNVELMTSGVSIPVVEGDIIQFKGNNTDYNGKNISSTVQFNVKGNIMSLTDGNNFKTADTVNAYGFRKLFEGCTYLVSAGNLKLPATTLADYCYSNMFEGCTSLTTAPELPVTTLADGCYYYMFSGCTSLITAPELPATTLANSCYIGMFQDCTALTTAPELPATTMVRSCYTSMFNGCTSLITAPELPSTTLAYSCYQTMFSGCTSLTTPPELPATTLAEYCYSSMFFRCTSLTAAPVLPATNLVQGCYSRMFRGCSHLHYIKAMFIATLGYTEDWVRDVSSTGTYVKNVAAQYNNYGWASIPSGWTIQTAEPDD